MEKIWRRYGIEGNTNVISRSNFRLFFFYSFCFCFLFRKNQKKILSTTSIKIVSFIAVVVFISLYYFLEASPVRVPSIIYFNTMASISSTNETTTTSTTAAAATPNNKRALIFLHGLGDTPKGWSSLKQQFSSQLSEYDIKWIFPAAPRAPVTISGGQLQTSWFDIFDWPIGVTARDDPKGLLESVSKITAIVEDCEKEGILPENIVLGGFSQGGAIALLTCWRYPKTLGGCISLSGWLTLREEFATSQMDGNVTPLFWGHGTEDPVVLPEQVPVGMEILQKNGITVKNEMYERMGHSSCPREMNDVLEFVKSSFA